MARMADGRVIAIDGSSEAPANVGSTVPRSLGGMISLHFLLLQTNVFILFRWCLSCAWISVCHDVWS